MSDPVLAQLQTEKPAILERLFDLVRIPSVSTDPTYELGMAEARQVLSARLRDMGLSNVHALEAGGHPALYGEWLAAGDRPTFLVYGHYDVQPPDPLEHWHSPPFEPQVRDGRIYGRGVSDDKAPSSIALETIAAFLSSEGGLPFNVKVLLEGEEEIGSPTLGAIIRKHRELLAVDAVISADGARWRADLTTVNVGSRGIAGFEFTVQTATKDLHSGRYGGAVGNALHVMAELVAGLHAPDGTVAVPGFYEGAGDIGETERQALAEIPFDEEPFFAAIGAAPLGEPGQTTLERLWMRPCLDVNGMWGGYTGPGGKTVIPNEAHAKVTLRLVPGQDPDRICQAVKGHLASRCPAGSAIRFGNDKGQSAAYELPLDHPLLHAVEAALTETHGSAPYRIRIGGTLPVSDIVRRELGVDTVMFSFSTADEDFHAPNEFFRLSSIDDGLRAWAALFRRLGETSARDFAGSGVADMHVR
jgi:acetylornithine deacetylase/succinyl-diaminopimelate desuccinylase-like protein